MRVVFVDRDGVINLNRKDHVKSWEEFVFLPRAVEALAQLTRHGFRTIVVTNQAVVNRGIISREKVDEINARMVAALNAAGAKVEGVFCCPHRPDEGCSCRKPRPGLLLEAARKLGVDLTRSYMVGDTLGDLAAGRLAGCRPVLVLTGRGTSQFLSGEARHRQGYMVSRDLWHAVRRILVLGGLVKPGWLEAARFRVSTPFPIAGTGVSSINTGIDALAGDPRTAG